MEWHSTRRFVWERKQTIGGETKKLGVGHPYTWIQVIYNVVYWVPMLLPFTPWMTYRQGVVGLTILIAVRAAANLYRNNMLTLEQAEVFPLRIP